MTFNIQSLMEQASEVDVVVVSQALEQASEVLKEGDLIGAVYHFGEAHGVLCLLESYARGYGDDVAESRLANVRVRLLNSVDNLRSLLRSPS